MKVFFAYALLFFGMATAIAIPLNGGVLQSDDKAAPPVKYQAVLRDSRGYVRADETVTLTLELLQEGTSVYKESHTVTTDALGQVQVYLGGGNAQSGQYRDIDWSLSHHLKVSDGKNVLADVPVSAVPTSLYAARAGTASTALLASMSSVSETALTAEQAEKAQVASTAETAMVAEALSGKIFDDDQEPDSHIYYSAAKVSRMIQDGGGQAQPGQTALAKEIDERKTEDLRILDSLLMETLQRMQEDQRIWDSLAIIKNKSDLAMTGLLDSLMGERRKRIEGDAVLQAGLDELSMALEQEGLERAGEDLRLWDSLGKVAASEQNVCEANDHRRGIYAAPIPIYDAAAPTENGLFTMPEMKILKQSVSCDLFADLDAADRLERSYKTRVMTYNATGSSTQPTSVFVPNGNSLVDVYVDNFLINTPVEYFTYDALVFDVEYYLPTASGGKGKMYVTLVRE